MYPVKSREPLDSRKQHGTDIDAMSSDLLEQAALLQVGYSKLFM